MMKNSHIVLLAGVFVFFFTVPYAWAGIELSLGNGLLLGYTQYRIGGKVIEESGSTSYHFPISELRFPLDNAMLKASVSADIGDRWQFRFSGQTNLTTDTGKMEDSDWGYYEGSSSDQLDIYSESDTEMDAWLFDTGLRYVFGSPSQSGVRDSGSAGWRFACSTGLGFKYQKYDFDVYDLKQWYPSGAHDFYNWVPGKVLTYEAEYQIPYLELGLILEAPQLFAMKVSIAYAPLADFKDRDDHLLRGKVLKADHDWNGEAVFGSFDVSYRLSRAWSLSGRIEGMYVYSEGRADAYINGEWDHSIEHEVESEQLTAFVSIGYEF